MVLENQCYRGGGRGGVRLAMGVVWALKGDVWASWSGVRGSAPFRYVWGWGFSTWSVMMVSEKQPGLRVGINSILYYGALECPCNSQDPGI